MGPLRRIAACAVAVVLALVAVLTSTAAFASSTAPTGLTAAHPSIEISPIRALVRVGNGGSQTTTVLVENKSAQPEQIYGVATGFREAASGYMRVANPPAPFRS